MTRPWLLIPLLAVSCSSPTTDADDDADAEESPPSEVAEGLCEPGAPLPACEALDPQSFGACGLAVGAVFDGASCVEVAGCECAAGADPCPPFANVGKCALACAATGFCQEEKIEGLHNLEGLGFCDELSACVAGPEAPASLVSCLPRLLARCDHDRCFEGEWTCLASGDLGGYSLVQIDEALRVEVCAATLLPEVTGVDCFVDPM